ncbi:MAG TPA: hypothetical protein VFX84_02470 [Candidatus Saccharimonadales bacterium]|nr:hypothetical protein [Candidatus Saccharimonadales bacterium]
MDQYAYNHSPRTTQRTFWDKLWKDGQGHQAVWQTPNAWLIAWAVSTTLSLFFGGVIGDGFFWIGSALLVVWSFLEIFQGSSYFRRVLGLAVLAYAIATMLNSL